MAAVCLCYCAQVSYTLPGPGGTNSNGLQDEIKMVLLDERYFRDTLPCSARQDWCVHTQHSTAQHAVPHCGVKAPACWVRSRRGLASRAHSGCHAGWNNDLKPCLQVPTSPVKPRVKCWRHCLL